MKKIFLVLLPAIFLFLVLFLPPMAQAQTVSTYPGSGSWVKLIVNPENNNIRIPGGPPVQYRCVQTGPLFNQQQWNEEVANFGLILPTAIYTSQSACNADTANQPQPPAPGGGTLTPPTPREPTEECPYVGYSITVTASGNQQDIGKCSVSTSDFIVSAQLTDVPPPPTGTSYYYCLKTKVEDCQGDEPKAIGSNGSTYDPVSGVVTIPRLCGDGNNKLKTGCDDNGSDWFHGGKIYRVSLHTRLGNIGVIGGIGVYQPIGKEASFYVTHYYPKVLQPKAGDYPPLNAETIQKNGKAEITVELGGVNYQGKADRKYNDYWVIVEGFDNDYKSAPGCIFVNPNTGTGSVTLNLPYIYTDSKGNEAGRLTAGSYVLKIKDAKDGFGWGQNGGHRCKENDFTYAYVFIQVGNGTSPGIISPQLDDPLDKEKFRTQSPSPAAPICDEKDKNRQGYCTKIPTALGIKINTEPQLFVRDVFTLVLSLGGIAATVFFIQAGYKLMTSAGNKEKVADAREQITSAIMGIVFIILSLVILEFIGVSILRIPGFGN